MCMKCRAKYARAQVRAWCIELAVALLKGTLHNDLLHQAAVVSAQAHALDPGVAS